MLNKHDAKKMISNTQTNATNEPADPKIYVSMTYIRGISERIAELIRKQADNVIVAFKNRHNLSSMFSKMKDKVATDQRCDVVYQVNCNECTDKQYIGTTSQMVKNRMAGHRSDCNRKSAEKSALVAHAVNKNHTFDFNNVKILATNNNQNKRMFLEELYIKSSKTCINKKSTEAANVSNIYGHLFDYLDMHEP